MVVIKGIPFLCAAVLSLSLTRARSRLYWKYNRREKLPGHVVNVCYMRELLMLKRRMSVAPARCNSSMTRDDSFFFTNAWTATPSLLSS